MNSLVSLVHASAEPLLYGAIIFLGLWSMCHKLVHFKFIPLATEVGIFWLVFTLHGGTMTGGFAATVAALLGGQIFPLMLPKCLRG